MDVESDIDQKPDKAIRAAIEPQKTCVRICRHCGKEFEVLERRGGRKYCGQGCAHEGKLSLNRQYRLAAQGGKRYCVDCGAWLDPPGSSGGRPKKYCTECSRRRLRRYEAEKKKRKNQKYQELKNVENEKKR